MGCRIWRSACCSRGRRWWSRSCQWYCLPEKHKTELHFTVKTFVINKLLRNIAMLGWNVPSDWLKIIMWQGKANESVLFQHATQKFNIDFYLVNNIGSQTCIFEAEEMTFSSFQSKVFNNRKQRNDIFVCFINVVIKNAIINFQGKYSLHWAS